MPAPADVALRTRGAAKTYRREDGSSAVALQPVSTTIARGEW